MLAATGEGAVLLLTGVPGVGKTTAIARVAAELPQGVEVRGFITRESRVDGRRVGFRVESLEGATATLAHVEVRSRQRVGKYGVDVPAFESVALPALQAPADVYLVDEIGKMECFSRTFVDAMEAAIESEAPLVATVAKKGGGFVERVKRHPRAELWEVTPENRDAIPRQIVEWIGRPR